jgi:hypothetical protein
MAEHRVRIEGDLGIEDEQLAAYRHRKRIDLDLRGVGADESLVELGKHRAGLLGELAAKPERRRDGTGVMGHQPGSRIDRDGLDLLGAVMSHRFDIHPAFGRGDHGDPAAAAVDEQRQIIFLRDIDAVGDVEPLHLLALGAGLDGDQGLAEHLGGVDADLVAIVR